MSTTNTTAVALSEAVVSLYPALANGQADYARPIWLGAAVQGGGFETSFNLRHRLPTGALIAKPVTYAQNIRLRFDRVWVRSAVVGQVDWFPGRARHVLEMTWRAAEGNLWSRVRFHGVAAEGGSWSADGFYSFAAGQTFTATRIEPLSGTGLLPEQVNLISVVSLLGDTGRELYRYDTGTGVYTEVTPGQADVLGVDLEIRGGDLVVGGETWWTAGSPSQVRVGVQVGGALPERRLDWRRGDRWLGSLSWRGFHVPASAQVAGPLTLPADGVAFSDGTIRAVLRAGVGLQHTGIGTF